MNTNTPTVSIIIPTYNMESFLARCLDSVLAQTYSAIEILIVDNGSVDATLSICESYQRKDSRIRIFSQEKKGVSNARNTGLEHVRGTYCAFVDADDTVSDSFVQKLVQMQTKTDAELVYCNTIVLDSFGTQLEDFHFKDGLFELDSDLAKLSYILRHYYSFEAGYAVWNKLFLTKIIKENHLTFCPNASLAEDVTFNMGYLMYCNRVCGSSEPLYYYLKHENSLSNPDRENHLFLNEYISNLQFLFQHMGEQPSLHYFTRHKYLLFALMIDIQFCKENAFQNYTQDEILAKSFWRKQLLSVLGHPFQLIRFLGIRSGGFHWRQNLKLLIKH